MQEFCKNLPKVELHAHLNGSLSRETLKTLAYNRNGFQTCYESTEKITLDQVFSLFKTAHDLTDSVESLRLATEAVIEDFYNDKVIYLELRTTPRCTKDMIKQEYIETVVKAIENNKKDIKVKLLLSIDRRHDFKTSEEALNIIIEMKKKYPDIIRGIDLCGNPHEGYFFSDIFLKAKQNGLFLTLHCSEIKNNEETYNMLQCAPDRMGHCTYLNPKYGGSEMNWNLYKQLNIPIECCLTSNIICNTSKSYEEHHVKEWYENGLPFTIGTDDRGVFDTELSKEFFHVHKSLGLQKDELWKISLQSVDYCFASKPEKEDLKRYLYGWKQEHL